MKKRKVLPSFLHAQGGMEYPWHRNFLKQGLNMVFAPPEKRLYQSVYQNFLFMDPGVLIKRTHKKLIKGTFNFILK